MNLEHLKEFSTLNRRYYLIPINNLKLEEITYIKKELTITPKVMSDYVKNVKPIHNFRENDKYLMIPRFWGIKNIGMCNERYGNITELDIEASFPPRDYQHDAINITHEKLLNEKGTTLAVAPGFGKTYVSLYLSSLLKTKTLILVHTRVLMDQWVERINTFIKNPRIGIIQGSKFDIEDKTHVIAMVQTLVSKTKNFTKKDFKDFGFTIYDETHHMAAPGFSNAFPVISTKYSLGLSATPKRLDGLEEIFMSNIGYIGYRSDIGGQITGEVRVRLIDYYSSHYKNIYNWKKKPDIHKNLEQIIKNKTRHKFIANIIKKILETPDRQILVLSSRVIHLKDMKKITDNLLGRDDLTSLYIGGMKTAELEESSKKRVLFATYQLVSEGTDIPTLNTLIQTCSKKNVEQVIGRIMRGKTPLEPEIYEINDNISVFQNQSKHRLRLYKKKKYNIYNYQIHEKKLDVFDYSFQNNILEEEKKEKEITIDFSDFF